MKTRKSLFIQPMKPVFAVTVAMYGIAGLLLWYNRDLVQYLIAPFRKDLADVGAEKLAKKFNHIETGSKNLRMPDVKAADFQ